MPHAVLTVRRMTVCAAMGFALPRATSAQYYDEPPVPTIAQAMAANAVVGGLTAALTAHVAGKNALRAFAWGLVGGAVHFAGKGITVGRANISGPAGLVIGAVGTSMVTNAGRGVGPLDEVAIPYGSLRLRITPREGQLVHAAINATESFNIAQSLAFKDLVADWRISLLHGALVMNTKNRYIVDNGQSVGGLEGGAVVVISSFAYNKLAVLRHELTHVQQERFITETWTRPIEVYVRQRAPGLSRLPQSIQIGILPLTFRVIEQSLWGAGDAGPVSRQMEAEARMFERR